MDNQSIITRTLVVRVGKSVIQTNPALLFVGGYDIIFWTWAICTGHSRYRRTRFSLVCITPFPPQCAWLWFLREFSCLPPNLRTFCLFGFIFNRRSLRSSLLTAPGGLGAPLGEVIWDGPHISGKGLDVQAFCVISMRVAELDVLARANAPVPLQLSWVLGLDASGRYTPPGILHWAMWKYSRRLLHFLYVVRGSLLSVRAIIFSGVAIYCFTALAFAYGTSHAAFPPIRFTAPVGDRDFVFLDRAYRPCPAVGYVLFR